MTSIQSTIAARVEALAPSMRRVAEAILARPQIVLEETISQLADRCDTSETTIIRFCRTLGLSGYVALRLAMASEIGREQAQHGRGDHGSDIRPEDDLATVVAKIAFLETLGISETLATLDIDALGRAAEAIDGAGRTLCYGVSASASAAEDLQAKLSRTGRVALHSRDPHDAIGAAALTGPGDVVVVFSHTGGTRETGLVLDAGRARGAFGVVVTSNPESALARRADVVLTTTARESRYRSGAMASRIAQLMVVDCLFVAVARLRHADTTDALRRTWDAAQQLR